MLRWRSAAGFGSAWTLEITTRDGCKGGTWRGADFHGELHPLSFYHNNLAASGQQQSLRRSAQLKAGAPRESPGCTISLFHPIGVRLFKVHAWSGGHLMPAAPGSGYKF